MVNYRLVSNLSFVSKVTERAVASQLNLVANDLLPHFQSVYRKRHFAETAMLRVWSYIQLPTDARSLCLASLTCRRCLIVSTATFYCSEFSSSWLVGCCARVDRGFSHFWLIGHNQSHSTVSYPASSRFCSVFRKVPYTGATALPSVHCWAWTVDLALLTYLQRAIAKAEKLMFPET